MAVKNTSFFLKVKLEVLNQFNKAIRKHTKTDHSHIFEIISSSGL